MRREGALASGYEAEVEGVKLTLSWVRDAVPHAVAPVMVCMDCRGIVEGFASHHRSDEVEIAELREMLDGIHVAISLQLIPGHVGLEGNE